MNDEIKQDRSPKGAVSLPLEEAVDSVQRLYTEVGKGSVSPEIAAKALGFVGTTGTSNSRLSALSQYQLINREKGKITVSQLALRILHPLGDDQRRRALAEAALAPEVFAELFREFPGASESVLASHLVHQGYTPHRADRVAQTFRKNSVYFPKETDSPPPVTDEVPPEAGRVVEGSARIGGGSTMTANPTVVSSLPTTPASTPVNVLARYSIPLGENEATLEFTGKRLLPEDFDALVDYVNLFKKQFERRQQKEGQPDLAENPAGIWQMGPLPHSPGGSASR